MFFDSPPPQPLTTYINNEISTSDYSDSTSSISPLPPQKQPERSFTISQDLSFTPPLFSLDQNAIKIPLTEENLRKHNQLMDKIEFEKKFIDINSITGQKILDDFMTPVSIQDLVNFIKYFVNKKKLSETQKNNLIFLIFKEVIKLKEEPFNFNKKELISTYVYLDRIFNEFNDFKSISGKQ